MAWLDSQPLRQIGLLLIADLDRPRSGTILTPMGPIEDVATHLATRRATLPS